MASVTLMTAVLTPRRWWRRLRGGHGPEVVPVASVVGRAWPGGLVRAALGAQRIHGVEIDQVDGTTCGPTVLVVLRAATDESYRRALVDDPEGLEQRLGDAQRAAHRQATRWWPRALGTTPWGMAAWLRRSGVARTRVVLVDAADPADLLRVGARVDAALAGGAAVPMLVGSGVPRHWCLALPVEGPGWSVYEPTSGAVRSVPAAAVRGRALRPLLGFDDLQAVLLPAP